MAFRSRQRTFKKSIDPEESRRKREEVTVELRKTKREEAMLRRRLKTSDGGSQRMGSTSDFNGDQKSAEMRRHLQDIGALVQGINSNDPTRQFESAQSFRRLLSIERHPPIQQVIECGVVPRLVEFLTFDNNPQLQFEAAWALTNIASGTTDHTRTVIEHGGVKIFVKLLSSQIPNVREQAVWALGNIAGDSHHCRDLVLNEGALAPLLQLCTPDAKLTMLRNATWTLSNFCRGKPQPPFQLVRPALPVLANLIFSQDDEVLIDACWAMSYLSDDNGPHNKKIQAVIKTGVCRRLIELLMHNNPSVQTPALRTVGNIVTGDDLQTQIIVNAGALPCLLSLLSNKRKGIRKEACWTISNVTAGNHDQIRAVISANIIPPLVEILRGSEFDVQKEAAWAISNATSGGTDEQIRFMVHKGVLPPLCELFSKDDAKIVMVALEGVENILKVGKKDGELAGEPNPWIEQVEECGGLDALEALQKHGSEEIYDKAVKILRDYFDSFEDETVENLAPQSNGLQFSFGGPSMGEPQMGGSQMGAGSGGFNFS